MAEPDGERPGASAAPSVEDREDRESCLWRLSSAIDGRIQRFFGKLGYFVGTRPWIVIALSLVFTLVCVVGVLEYEEESRAEKLWTPGDSLAQRHVNIIRDNFPREARRSTFYIRPKSGNSHQILTYPVLHEMLDVQLAVVNDISVVAAGRDGEERWNFTTLCETQVSRLTGSEECMIFSILDVWNRSRVDLQRSEDAGDSPVQVINRGLSTGSLTDRFGDRLDLNQSLGGMEWDSEGQLVRAAVGRLEFRLEDRSFFDSSSGEDVDRPAEGWELEVVEQFEPRVEDQSFEHIRLYMNTPAFAGEENSRAIQGDLNLISASMMLIIVFLAVQLRVDWSCVGCRIGLAIAGAVTVGMGLGIGYGLGSPFAFFAPVHNVLPFVVAGIGVDNLFLVVNEFSLTLSQDPIPKRMSDALRHAGSSMTTTTLTDFVAFMMGSLTSLPALSSFCIWASFAVLGILINTVTFFAACVVLDQQRRDAHRADFFCCLRCRRDDAQVKDVSEGDAVAATSRNPAQPPRGETDAEDHKSESTVATTSDREVSHQNGVHSGGGSLPSGQPRKANGQRSDDEDEETSESFERPATICSPGIARWFLREVYAPFLMKTPVKVGVVVGFVALLGASTFGLTELEQEFRFEWFLPGDSPLQDWFQVDRTYFSDFGSPVFAVAGDYCLFENRELIPQLTNALRENPFVSNQVPVQSWWARFAQERPAAADADSAEELTSLLQGWLQDAAGSGPGFANDVVLSDSDPDVIRITRVSGILRSLDSASQEVDAMDTIRRDVRNAARDAGLGASESGGWQVFAFSFDFLEWEQFDVLAQEAAQNIGLAIVAVAMVILLVLASPVMTVILTFNVGLVLLNILGMMALWNVFLDAVSIINLVLAIGLAVDYGVHIGHAFMHKHGTRNERAIKAISEMGLSVINGGVSTFIAVVVLSGSDSYVFRVFFKMFFLTVVFGLAYGLILLPVVLSLIGPAAHHIVKLETGAESRHTYGDNVPRGTKEHQAEPV